MVANSLGWAIRDTEPSEARSLLDEVIELEDLAMDVSLPLAHANRAVLNAREGRWAGLSKWECGIQEQGASEDGARSMAKG